MDVNGIGGALGWLLTAGYGALTLVEALRYFRTGLAEGPSGACPAERLPWPRLLGGVLIAFALSRLLVFGGYFAAYLAEHGSIQGLWTAFVYKLTPWDADHYLGIIENLYVTQGDARLHLVFLPFYPMVCRALCKLTGLSAFASAVLVSNAALVGSGMAMYRLVELDGDAALARRSALLLMFCPMTYFFSIPYTESTFMLVTLLAVLCARRRRWPAALLFGAMASCTRVVGMAVAIPIFWELLRAEAEADGERGLAPTPARLARRVALCALRTLPVGAGLIAYLVVNYRLYGNPTQFLIFQKQNWHQSFGSMANTFRYCLVNAIAYDDALYQLGVWRPQALLLIAVPLLILWRRKRQSPRDTAYLLVTHYVNFAPTWLLSGARYTSGTYALYPLLAGSFRGRRGFAGLLAGECALLVYMTIVGFYHVRVY